MLSGRKTKLTKELIKEAEKLMRIGNYTETVCQFLGIHKSTWYKWMAEGEKARSGLKREFFDAIRKAESTAEIRNVQKIQAAVEEGDANLALKFLERKFPARWGRKDQVSADINHSGEIKDKKEYDITHRIDQYEGIYQKAADRVNAKDIK